MRLALVLQLTGVLMLILAAAMLPSIAIAWLDQGADLPGLVTAGIVSGAVGATLALALRRSAKRVTVRHREGFLIVGVGWLAAGLISALPFYLYPHMADLPICGQWPVNEPNPIGYDFCSFTNSAFEAISGFTTTGATIVTDGLWNGPGTMMSGDRLGLPRGILLWRSMTHFLGGMGIIVLGVAILPLLGVGGMQLFKAEVPGPTADKLVPRVAETARILWKVYLLLSLVQFVLLTGSGMGAFNAICHTMATMATGGFSTLGASVAGFESPYVEWVITIFMYLAGVNFTLHFLALSGRIDSYLRDPEWRFYTALFVGSTLAAASSLYFAGQSFGFFESLRLAAFQVASIITTTGFASHDFELWIYAPVALLALVALMFCGGMAGSTGGGIKVVRQLLLIKQWVRETVLLVHPNAVRPVRLGGRRVPDKVMRAVFSFMAAYVALLTVGSVVFTLDGQDIVTAFTASLATLGNIGPGLGNVGPFDNYAHMGDFAKWIASALMLLGRLEIYTLLVLLTPVFWKR